MSELDDFEAWLAGEGYAGTSVTKLVRDVRVLRDYNGASPHAKSARRGEALRWAWSCWAEWCELEGLDNALPEPAREEIGRRRRLGRGARRLNPAESIPTDEWLAFLAVVEADDRVEARVIDVQCSTALRIGDVLRSSRAALERGFGRSDGITALEVKGSKPVVVCVKGGAELEWRRLYDASTQLKSSALVCEAISPSSGPDWTAQGAAYRQVDRYLKILGERAGVSGRVVTHRLRRTVAVQAGLAGVPRFMIQKMLHHSSGKTTDGYMDESLAREVADLASRVRGRAV